MESCTENTEKKHCSIMKKNDFPIRILDPTLILMLAWELIKVQLGMYMSKIIAFTFS